MRSRKQLEPLTHHATLMTSCLEWRPLSIDVLAKGGFKFKHVIRSGEKPPEGASSDGES